MQARYNKINMQDIEWFGIPVRKIKQAVGCIFKNLV